MNPHSNSIFNWGMPTREELAEAVAKNPSWTPGRGTWHTVTGQVTSDLGGTTRWAFGFLADEKKTPVIRMGAVCFN